MLDNGAEIRLKAVAYASGSDEARNCFAASSGGTGLMNTPVAHS
jgi:hypothetical protein